jgi:uncharacterized protein YecT (DUF1311 family)
VRASSGLIAVTAAAAIAVGGASARQIPQPALGCLKTAQSSAEMSGCVGEAYAKAKQELAAVYGKALAGKGLVPGDRTLLAQAERQWIRFRDADCSYAESLNKGGTLAAVDKGICLIRDTIDRANALQDYLASS